MPVDRSSLLHIGILDPAALRLYLKDVGFSMVEKMSSDSWEYTGLAVALFLVAVLFIARNFNEWTSFVRLQPGAPPLPPGSMGWPILGETIQFMTVDFASTYRLKFPKFGRTWKTHLFGCPTIVTTTAESARQVLGKQSAFEASYPKTMAAMIGPKGLLFLSGTKHTRVRRLLQSAMLPDMLRTHVASIERLVLLSLADWDGKTVYILKEAQKFSFNCVVKFLYGARPSEDTERFWMEFGCLDQAIYSLPFNVPWTAYHRGLQARSRIINRLQKIIEQRRSESGIVRNDVLEAMINSQVDGLDPLTNEEIQDNLVTFMFAGQDTTACALHWAIYHLNDRPDLVEDLRDEAQRIRDAKSRPDEPLTYAEVKSMQLTHWVMYESVRLNIAGYVFREAQKDVVLDGFTVPKGWKVQAMTRYFHTDPVNFPDPLKFNPYRYKVPPKASSFMLFGSGARICPGMEFSKLEAAVFLHHFISKYNFKVAPNPKRKVEIIPIAHWDDNLPTIIHKRQQRSANAI